MPLIPIRVFGVSGTRANYIHATFQLIFLSVSLLFLDRCLHADVVAVVGALAAADDDVLKVLAVI